MSGNCFVTLSQYPVLYAASTADWRDAVPCLEECQKVAGGKKTESFLVTGSAETALVQDCVAELPACPVPQRCSSSVRCSYAQKRREMMMKIWMKAEIGYKKLYFFAF